MKTKTAIIKAKRRLHINPDYAARIEEREKRISEREARKDQQFEKLFETLGLLAGTLSNKSEPPQFIKAPDYNCGIYVDGVRAVEIIRLPALGPAQDLLSGLVMKHVGAREFQLVLTIAEG